MSGRAIVVTPRMPWPLDDGGRIGLWQMLWSVTRQFETTLVTLVPPDEMEREVPRTIADLGATVCRVPHRPPNTPWAILQGLAGPWPYTLARYRSRKLDQELHRLVTELRPRFVLLNHLHLAPAMDALAGTPAILREHNVEFVWLERYAQGLRNPAARAYARQQARRTRAAEAALCERAALVLAIQEQEARVLREIAPRARVEVIPIGIDVGRYLPQAPEEPPIVLLVASFGWAPNADGARRFLSEGWAQVRASLPGVRLRLVGKDLPADVAETARALGAEPVGYVEHMPPEFARASVAIVPLWVGAGSRVKIVESLAAGVPVVSTPIGVEGLGMTPGRHHLEAETPAGMAESIVTLLRAPSRGAELAAAGRALAVEQFSLESVARRTNELCMRAAPITRAEEGS